MNGIVTYGFGKSLNNSGFPVVYGFLKSSRIKIQLNFSLSIQQGLLFDLER